MTIRVSAGLLSILVVAGLGSAPSFAGATPDGVSRRLQTIQYDRSQDQRGYENRDNRGGYDDRDNRGGYDNRDGYGDRGGHKWRPGEALPGPFLNRVVNDWEERGLSRPPSGHQWVRVGQQFVLVRGRDRMIARILNFD